MSDFALSADQKQQVETLSTESLVSIQRRARLLLLYETGLSTREVAAQVRLSPRQTRYWRRQFLLRGLAIFPALDEAGEACETSPVEAMLEDQDGATAEIPFPLPMAAVGILPDDSMAEAGRKVMLYNFAEMLAHEQGTRLGQDAEELHDMRVATRRLRAAMAVFEEAFHPKTIKPFVKGLRLTGRALGRARDLDVILENAFQYQNSLPPEDQHGLQPLVQFWRNEQAQAHSALLEHLDNPKYSGFIRKFNVFVNTRGLGVKPVRDVPPTPHQVREVAPALIYTRLEAVRAYERILSNATIAQLHALRIECKRFRYTVEFFREVLGEQVRGILNELKGMQDHLGELHDADVACQIVRQFLADWDAQQAALPLAERLNPQPIVSYLAYLSAELHRLIISFPQVWAHFNQPEFRMNLALAIARL